ncbi:MAG: RelA/SpoT family protein [Acidimicrobiales bacterium]
MGTADRVLPWRRHHSAPIEELTPLLASFRRRHPKSPVTMVNRAYETARAAHQNQMRSSGEAYINHPIAVARIVADTGLDEVSLAAALLHDAVEDTEITLDDVRRDFGEEVAALVDGVTKLDRIQFDSREEQQAATMRKMLVAMARDIRVLVIKLADRLHNMRTLAGTPVDKQQRVAQETLDIYAPLAHRLGMDEMKQQLEDLAFSALHPKRFAELDHLVSSRTPERDVYLAKAIAEVQGRLAQSQIVGEVTGRGKHLWSIYEKMVQKDRDFEEIFDLNAIRIIVDNVRDCYAALGCIHGRWKPVVGRFKDYIAMPKFNLYQSLHTTVIGPGGKPLEVQIRTREMHEQAEFGVAAHFTYKHGAESGDMDWLNRIIDWQTEALDPDQFLAELKSDLDQEEIFVFTPKGRVITLPVNSTPVDFAYAVHTEVGHRCVGARVNGRLVPLDGSLNSGDTCEIFTSKVEDAGPSRDWLGFVRSPRARNKIKQWFTRERREDMVEAGRDELAAELRREGLPVERIWASEVLLHEMEAMNISDPDTLFASIGEHHVSARTFAQRIGRAVRNEAEGEVLAMPMRADRTDGIPRSIAGIHVEGLDDVLVRLSRCCTPVPGDDIVGFVTKGRGVSVHRADCANATTLAYDEPTRLVEVEWSGSVAGALFRAGVEVVALDRSRLLRDVANSLSEQHVNIVACTTHTGSDKVARMRFEFELGDPNHLDSVLRTIKAIDSVYDAYRIVPGGGSD